MKRGVEQMESFNYLMDTHYLDLQLILLIIGGVRFQF